VTVTIVVEGADKAAAALDKLPEKVFRFLRRELEAESRVLATQVQRRHLTGGTTGSRLAVRTGQLRASTRPVETQIVGSWIKSGIGFGTRYAPVHVGPKFQETEIRPKRRQWLTIPLPAAQTKSKVGRGRAADDKVDGKYVSALWGNTFVAKSKKGNLIVFGKRKVQRGASAGAVRGDVVPLFLLVKKVKIRTRVHPENIIGYAKPRLIRALQKVGLTAREVG